MKVAPRWKAVFLMKMDSMKMAVLKTVVKAWTNSSMKRWVKATSKSMEMKKVSMTANSTNSTLHRCSITCTIRSQLAMRAMACHLVAVMKTVMVISTVRCQTETKSKRIPFKIRSLKSFKSAKKTTHCSVTQSFPQVISHSTKTLLTHLSTQMTFLR